MNLQTGTVPPKKVTAVSHFLSHSPAPYYTVSLTPLTLQHNPPPLQAHTEAVAILDNVFNVGPCTNEVYKIFGIFDPLFPVCMKLHSIQNNLLTMSDFGVPPPPQSRRRLYMVPLRIRANWSCAGAKNETHGACHCHAMLLAQNREELQFIFATPASAPPVFLVRRSCVHLGCSPNGVMTNRPRFGRRSGTVIVISSVRSLMC